MVSMGGVGQGRMRKLDYIVVDILASSVGDLSNPQLGPGLG